MSEPNLYCYASHGYDDDPHAIRLRVSAEDRERFDELPREDGSPWAEVTDLATGHVYEVRSARCGASCFCAAEARIVRTQREAD